MATVPAIELIDVQATLGDERVLRGVSFAVRSGSITALLGPSGAGKTTCLRAIVGLLEPDQGDILVEGRSTLSMRRSDRLAISRRFGVMFQGAGVYGSALWDSMSVQDNVILQLRTQRPDLDDATLERRCRERLYEIGLTRQATLMPSALSAGERRRLAFARALVSDPEFAVLDSPELGLDPVRLRGLASLIAERQMTGGGTYLFATQSIQLARELADDIVVLYGGRVLAEGPADNVLHSSVVEVQQLVSGSTDGPLGMHPDPRSRRQFQPPRLSPPGEQGFELPVPVVAGGLLVAITGSALWFGGAQPWELVIVAIIWVLTGVLLGARNQRNAAAGKVSRQRRE